ncbi:L,D-transpeptidase family protein [Phenylobacterium sp. J426]|uniref:L,D-transpeptidase family protein n=1 Tax=Phenylobacterium sp. J426 TaxID=2898439 RepID=UPI002151B2A7|nr:L,D-transpeptidase family protein [Phenylobacterium sp. J426]MCR5874329.1 L,D-transpeptidase family protein [Phenylobacterium sp. J426]
MNSAKALFLAGAAALSLAACGERAAQTEQARAPDVNPAPLHVPPAVTPSSNPVAQAIDKAQFTGQPLSGEAQRALLIRAQVLLDRAHFSPGVIDGTDGENMKNAVAAFERARSLPEDGLLDREVWNLLVKDEQPVMTDYVITEDDVAGPFAEKIPTDYKEMAKLERLSFTSPLEALAEKFHMDEALLTALNPGADFAKAGTRIVVAAPGPDVLVAPVALVEVDKGRNQVRAYGADGSLLASYPATVGSSDMPTPDGEWAVNLVANDPHWNYDPKKTELRRQVGRQAGHQAGAEQSGGGSLDRPDQGHVRHSWRARAETGG